MLSEPIYTDKDDQKRHTTIEGLVRPENLPEAAFQSYEMFTNDADARRPEFLAGEVRNPELHYPKLESLDGITQGALNLADAIEQVRSMEQNDEIAGIVATSLEFRLAEMEYVKLLGRLNADVESGAPEAGVRVLADQIRSLGHELYEPPQEAIVNSALGEVWEQIDRKQLSESAQRLYDELGEALPRPELYEKLPDFNHPSLAWAGEIILNENRDIEALLRAWWDDMVEEYGEDFVAHPEDIANAFSCALQHMDKDNSSGVTARVDPDAKALSWESSEMAIVVGGKRGPIKTSEELFQKFLHEGIGHGGRAINGLKTGIPVLGTGLFTHSSPRADYLTFEEGLCTTIEEVVSGEEPKWDAAKLGHYINIALAEGGKDFRTVFESAWRYRLLMGIGDEEDVTAAMLKKYQTQAYTAVVRIFRGTPTLLSEKYPGIDPLVYGKDGAYLSGRIIFMKYLEEIYEERAEGALLGLFDAKFDPTIPEQAAIVAKFTVAHRSDNLDNRE